MKATASMKLTGAMLAITEEVGELYYSEWLAILADEQRRIIGLMLVEDWREDEP